MPCKLAAAPKETVHLAMPSGRSLLLHGELSSLAEQGPHRGCGFCLCGGEGRRDVL